jgi:hypothetical protein
MWELSRYAPSTFFIAMLNPKEEEAFMREPVEIFISYAHNDMSYRERLTNDLRPLQRQKRIQVWSDVAIELGTEWRKAIGRHLETAHIFLLLISSDFLASDYCWSVEMNRAMERHERGEARVIPIVVSTIAREVWETAPFSKLQALPQDAKPIRSWRDKDQAYASIINGISKSIESITTTPSVPSSDTCAHHLESAGTVSKWDGEGELPVIVASDSLAHTSSTLRLRNGEALDPSLIIETHARLITIGRAPKNMVRLPDDVVSWEHGMIIFKEGEYSYCHVSKSKPTMLRRRGLEQLFRPGKQEEAVLRNQDRLIIGKTTLILECDLINEDGGYRTTAKTSEEEDDAG